MKTTRHTYKIKDGRPVVVTTKRKLSLAEKLVDAALKKAGK